MLILFKENHNFLGTGLVIKIHFFFQFLIADDTLRIILINLNNNDILVTKNL